MSGRLEGKVAVITGGASGIGAATAALFVDEGARVVIGDMQADVGEETAGRLGANCAFQPCDVSKEADVAALVEAATSRWGRLDAIYNNAGFGGALGPIESLSEDDIDITFDVLLKGVIFGMKYAAPVMKAQESGSIISTASVAGLTTGYGPHLYNVAKAAVIHLTRSVANELAEQNIRVNCICPGFIATPLAANAPIGTSGRDAAEARIQKMRDQSGPGPAAPPGRRGVRHRQGGPVPRLRRQRVDHGDGDDRGRRLPHRPAVAQAAGVADRVAPDSGLPS